MTLYLSGEVGGQAQTWTLEGETLGLGRSSKNRIHIADGTVSKDHAEFLRRDGRWYVRDRASRNGTRVNGADAREPTEIRPGDRIEIGHIELRVAEQPQAVALRLSEGTVLDSSLEFRVEDILERGARGGGTSARLVRVLAEAGRLLVLPRPLRETCDELLQFVEQAVPGSRYVLMLREEGGEPVQIAARARGGRAREPLALSRGIMSRVLDQRASVVTADAALDPRFLAQHSVVAQSIHSAMAVPLFDNERVLGLLYVDSHDPGMRFGEEQLELLTLLANMAAVKITNARLLENQQAHERMAHELAAAAEIQRGLLPLAPPALPGWRCDAFLESCYEVGGDLYDFHVGQDGGMTVVVGDVTGKGMGAALLASSFLSSWRVLVDSGPDLSELARRLNAVTHRPNDAGRFVTGVIARLDPRSGTLEVVNAGHPPPALALDGELRRLELGGPPFGIRPDSTYPIERAELRRGELLAICTDGIPEARHGEDFFEDERFTALLRAAGDQDPAALRERVLGEVRSFVGDEPRSDDITLVLIRRDR